MDLTVQNIIDNAGKLDTLINSLKDLQEKLRSIDSQWNDLLQDVKMHFVKTTGYGLFIQSISSNRTYGTTVYLNNGNGSTKIHAYIDDSQLCISVNDTKTYIQSHQIDAACEALITMIELFNSKYNEIDVQKNISQIIGREIDSDFLKEKIKQNSVIQNNERDIKIQIQNVEDQFSNIIMDLVGNFSTSTNNLWKVDKITFNQYTSPTVHITDGTHVIDLILNKDDGKFTVDVSNVKQEERDLAIEKFNQFTNDSAILSLLTISQGMASSGIYDDRIRLYRSDEGYTGGIRAANSIEDQPNDHLRHD